MSPAEGSPTPMIRATLAEETTGNGWNRGGSRRRALHTAAIALLAALGVREVAAKQDRATGEHHRNGDGQQRGKKRGKRGERGEAGPGGPAGSPGSPGDKGDKGDPGSTGGKGDKGDQGGQGEMGGQGPAGPAGMGSCPAGKVFVGAVGCVDQEVRGTASFHEASTTCIDSERLLTSAELLALLRSTTVNIHLFGEWSGTVTSNWDAIVVGSITDGDAIVKSRDNPSHFRCMSVPSIVTP